MTTYRNIEISYVATITGKPFCVTAIKYLPRHWYFESLSDAREFAFQKLNKRYGVIIEADNLDTFDAWQAS